MRAFLAATTIVAISLLPRIHGAQVALSDPRIGTSDSSGNLIIHVYTAGGAEPIFASLTTDYGVMLFRGPDGRARFLLADRRKATVREFTDYAEYLGALSALPRTSVLHIYDRCTVSVFSDFYPSHQELYQKFRKDCRKRSLTIATDPKTTCTCAHYG